MSDEIKLELKITTGAASQQYKDNWEKIFGKPKYKKPTLCGACGFDLSTGKMCKGCTEAIERRKDK